MFKNSLPVSFFHFFPVLCLVMCFLLYNLYSSAFLGFFISVTPGPSVGLAVTAWVLGVTGTSTILKLRTKATVDQDGPCRKCFVPSQQQAPVPPPGIAQPLDHQDKPHMNVSVPPQQQQVPVPPPVIHQPHAPSAVRGPPPVYTEDTV